MKYLPLILVFIACQKGEQCTERNALNNRAFNTCEFSKVSFYSSTNEFKSDTILNYYLVVEGNTIDSTDLFLANDTNTCISDNRLLNYQFTDSATVLFTIILNMKSGKKYKLQKKISPDSYRVCINYDIVNL